MVGRTKQTVGLISRVVGCYLICALLFGLFLAAAAMLAFGGATGAPLSGWAPLIALVSLALISLGGWLIFRQLVPLAGIDAQLRRLAVGDSLAATQVVTVRNAATLGWNRIVEHIHDETSSASIAERLEAALADHGAGDIQGALQSLSEGVAITDSQGHITFANRALAALIADGCDEEQIEKANIFTLLAQETNVEDNSLLDADAMHTVVSEVSSSTAGKSRYLRAARHPVRSGESHSGYVWSIRDVTQQRLANQMRDQFLDSATHELRTPLANIKAYAETLALDDMIDVECQKDFCNTINSEATRLARLIDDLLDLSSMEVGSLSISRQNVHLDRLLRDVVEKITPLMEKKDLTFNVELPEKLPEVQLDKDKISTTLVNLLGNAAKYTHPGGTVTLRVKLSSQQLQIDVEDTGVGIPESDLSHVFEKFFRSADQQVQSETGTGLGLSIAREIVHLHGGDLTVQSQLGAGSTFTILLPRGKGEQ